MIGISAVQHEQICIMNGEKYETHANASTDVELTGHAFHGCIPHKKKVK